MTDIREHPPPATLAAGNAEGPGEGEAVGIETFLVCGAGHEGTDGVMTSSKHAYGLLRWWRWLAAVGVDWNKATSAEVRDFVLWMGQASKPRNALQPARPGPLLAR